MAANQAVIYIDDLNQESIDLLTPLRVLKGKRAVFEANWNGQTVLVKLFSKEKYWLRERNGLGFFAQSGISSPELLYKGLVVECRNLMPFGLNCEQPLYILILEFYQNAIDFRSQWRLNNVAEKKRKTLFTKLIILLAQHHQVGIVQKDLHLGNFLIVDDGLVTIDGDAVEYNESLSMDDCYQQLGTLLAQSFPKYDAMLETLLPYYFSERKLDFDTEVIERVLISRNIARNIAKKNWINKAYRESSQFKVAHAFNYHICIVRSFVSDELIKQVFSLRAIRDNSVEWVDKGYQYKAVRYSRNLMSQRRWLVENEASQCWLNAQIKVFFGESTITPVALVINKIGPFHNSGFFVEARKISVG